ncbi:MAG: tRNA lysidine(34) synthetase TilS [Bacilli bacterium]|nr:tRNA lysidine(34) synthetase TilS [Bacilli bacterium]
MNIFSYPKDKKYLIGVSGGPDSMALLNMLYLQGYDLVICHVNYHKRKESNYEQEEIYKYARERNIPMHVLDTSSLKVEGNFQAWAREVRYKFFKEQYDFYKAGGLFIAHNEDDLLETYLMQKKRHNIVSYYGIKEENDIYSMKVIRPLLSFTKKSLLDYCIKNQVFYSIDSSNLKDDYTRNKIRHAVVEKMTIDQKEKLLNEISNQNKKLEEHYKKAEELLLKKEKEIKDFKMLDDLSQNIFLYLFISEKLPFISKKLSLSRIYEIKKIISSSKPNVRILLYPPYYFIRSYDKFLISESINQYDYAYIINEPRFVDEKEFSVDLRNDTSPLNIYSYSYPLTIRNVRKGDVVKFGSIYKKVNRILIDEKIPLEQRKKYPVILDNKGDIVYIPLYRSINQKFIANKLRFVIK